MATKTGIYNVGKRIVLDTDLTGTANTNLYLSLHESNPVVFEPDSTQFNAGTKSVVTTDGNAEATTGDGYTAFGKQFSAETTAVTVSADVQDTGTPNPDSGRWTVAGGSDTAGSLVWGTIGGTTANVIDCGLLFWAATPATPATSDEPIALYELASSVTTNGSDLTWTWGTQNSQACLLVLTNVLV